MSTTKLEQEFIGKVVQLDNRRSCLVVVALNELENIKIEFRLFDLLRFTSDIEIGDKVRMYYVENKKNDIIYNKVISYAILEKECNEVLLEGTINNLRNTRGKKSKNEVAFTVKGFNGGLVYYCYMNKALSESRWFKKGQNIIMEAIPLVDDNLHSSYKILSLWGR